MEEKDYIEELIAITDVLKSVKSKIDETLNKIEQSNYYGEYYEYRSK